MRRMTMNEQSTNNGLTWKCAALFPSAYESKYQVLKKLLEVASPLLILLLTSLLYSVGCGC